jgi:IMP dehydrogenase
VDVSSFGLQVPIISSNMETITEWAMCYAIESSGGIGAMHRFMSIEENITQYKFLKKTNKDCFISIGVNEDSLKRAKALFDVGATKFIIDIAHGHSIMVKNTLLSLRKEFGNNIHIMAGNVATPQAVKDLEEWGADSIKVGIANGAVCLTKNVTGVVYPMFSSVVECAEVANVPIIADGNIREIGDICKAIGAGASAVMIGSMFAGCDETPYMNKTLSIIEDLKRQNKYTYELEQKLIEESLFYRGMASRDAMLKIKDPAKEILPTPEGKSIKIERKGSVKDIMQHIKGGMQSSYSYSNAKNTKDFQLNVEFGLRMQPPNI